LGELNISGKHKKTFKNTLSCFSPRHPSSKKAKSFVVLHLIWLFLVYFEVDLLLEHFVVETKKK